MALVEPIGPLLSYEEYMSEPEIIQRYDIIEGVRYFMPGATWQHQRILRHIASLLEQYEVNTGKGFTLAAPLDVLIRRAPLLQTRQPDVFFITVERLAEGGGVPQRGPLTIGPELVVEIVSDSERAQMLAGKLADYASIGVIEAWVVRPPTKTVEVILLSGDGIASKFTDSEELRSHIFADLSLQVADFFKP